MKPITYIKGDLFAALPDSPVLIPHVCNNLGLWGAGFVVPLGRRFPNVARDYQQLGNYKLGETHFVEIEKPAESWVCNMIGQNGVIGADNPKPLLYAKLADCMERVAEFCINKGQTHAIHAPKFGSGLAGGKWDYIEELIKEIWLPVTSVTIYSID